MAEHCGHHGRITYSRELRNSAGVKQSQSRLQFPDFVPSQKNDSSPSGPVEHVPAKKERDGQHSNARGRGGRGGRGGKSGRGDKGVQRFEHKQRNMSVGKESEVGCNTPFTSFGRGQVRRSTYDVNSRRRGGRRGRGSRGMFGGGGRRTFRLDTIMDIEDATELTLKLTIMIHELEEFLNSNYMSADDVETMVKVLVRVTECELQRESVLSILRIVGSTRFLEVHLASILMGLRASSLPEKLFEVKVVSVAQMITTLFRNICSKLPSLASRCSILLTSFISQSDVANTISKVPRLAEDVSALQGECEAYMTETLFPKERRSRVQAQSEDNKAPPDNFQHIPIFPESRDLDGTVQPFLRAIKTQGAFSDTINYLDIQFRLLREDFIRPLRNGVTEYRCQRAKGEPLKKNQDIRLYFGVHIRKILGGERIEHVVQFDMKPFQRTRWQSSKRLIHGSLVCLSKDDFETSFYAVVTKREVEHLEKGLIQIRFENCTEEVLNLSSEEELIMAETTAYFEAYRHVLEGLQEVEATFPMSRYIVDCQKMVKPPAYLIEGDSPVKMDLTSLLHSDSAFNASEVTVINPKTWPSHEDTVCNAGQVEVRVEVISSRSKEG